MQFYESVMMLNVPAPNFSCRSTQGTVKLSDYRGRWLVFFSHPADFTPVCTSEFVAFARARDAFLAEDCDLLGLSVDSLFSHIAWTGWIEERFGTLIKFPIAEDPSMTIARAYGMLGENANSSETVRATFLIDPQGIIRATWWYPMTTGRNIDEILRTVRALRTSDTTGTLTPAGWQPGDEVIDADPVRGSMPIADWLYRTHKPEVAV
ncbi:peroxiredoxin [Brucella intermedia GD04153]|uniref:Thioredoxin peroxidase n=1 Tax=Brucella intermedia GD04153 TaxID=2975438 RepID=A0AA42H1C1_9HYPH|nr:peroxiredoxin [Brucella intermedia]MDH0126843.1 peroxiredoxin [Brucella intermedia GD04153]RRD21996.1 peroxiredoxin [Brucellaceae bacterium VT-16-1752]